MRDNGEYNLNRKIPYVKTFSFELSESDNALVASGFIDKKIASDGLVLK